MSSAERLRWSVEIPGPLRRPSSSIRLHVEKANVRCKVNGVNGAGTVGFSSAALSLPQRDHPKGVFF